MKLRLIVVGGVHEGKAIPINLPQFVIGRDPQCQLRPASAAISKRHCAIMVRGSQVFIRDFGSTNGTFVNGELVQGEVELHGGDKLKVGPLEFTVGLEVATTPKAAVKPAPAVATAENVPEGSTIMEMPATGKPGAPGTKPPVKTVLGTGNTSSAAAEILRKYQRRPRSQ
jgi:pSer/pThr/pTyr-binding forkhead associated (FHA) protein